MKLELKHLAPYLPYDLKMYWENLDGQIRDPYILLPSAIDHIIDFQNKPIMRPLSDLTKEIEYNGCKFIPLIYFGKLNIEEQDWHRLYIETDNKIFFNCLFNTGGDEDDLIVYFNKASVGLTPYERILELLQWHFDVFGLIEKGLAIDINTLKS